MLSRLRVMLVVVGVAGSAHASVDHAAPQRERAVPVPQIAIGAPDDPLVSIVGLVAEVREADDGAVVTVRLSLDGPVDAHTGRMAISLPPDARVVGMTYARGGESLRASVREATEARDVFTQTEMIKRDPALLEWKDAGAVELAVYPVTSGEHPTATVVIAMPKFRALRVNAGTSMQRELDGVALAPAADEEVALAKQAPVQSGVSLLAMPPPSLDDFDVRLEKSHAEIQQCAKLDSAPGDITLAVTIGADGNVREASAGDSATGACLAQLASRWRFGADEKPVAMHLRLHLGPG